MLKAELPWRQAGCWLIAGGCEELRQDRLSHGQTGLKGLEEWSPGGWQRERGADASGLSGGGGGMEKYRVMGRGLEPSGQLGSLLRSRYRGGKVGMDLSEFVSRGFDL